MHKLKKGQPSSFDKSYLRTVSVLLRRLSAQQGRKKRSCLFQKSEFGQLKESARRVREDENYGGLFEGVFVRRSPARSIRQRARKRAAARRARAEKNTRPRAADRRHKTPRNTGARERQPAAGARKYTGATGIVGAHARRGRRKIRGRGRDHGRTGTQKYAGGGRVTFWR